MRQNSEPSVEEILESIKKVIARDSRIDTAQRAQRDPEAAPAARFVAPKRGPDVLDLTEVAAQILANDRFSPSDNDDDDAEEEPALVARAKADSMRDSLATLAMMAQPGASPQIVRSGETSLEGMVRDMLRPMLAEWLDVNLPNMVEKMVSAEIARIVGKRS